MALRRTPISAKVYGKTASQSEYLNNYSGTHIQNLKHREENYIYKEIKCRMSLLSQAMAWVLVIGNALNQKLKQSYIYLNHGSEKSKVLTYVQKS